MMRQAGWVLATLVAFGGGCGSGTPEADVPKDVNEVGDPDQATPSGGPGGGNVPSIDAEVGAMDQAAVDAAFSAARPAIKECIKKANQGLAFEVIGGDMQVEIRVDSDGAVKWAFPRKSTIGHRGAETCVLDVLRGQTWPKPEGGEDGIARTSFGLDAPAARPPVMWSASELGKAGSKVGNKIISCRSKTGAESLEVTIYVDASGKVMAAGASTSDEKGIDALDCAVDAAKSQPFPSPGSYPAKVMIGG